MNCPFSAHRKRKAIYRLPRHLLINRSSKPQSRKRARSPTVTLANDPRKRVHLPDSALGYDDEDEDDYANDQDDQDNFSDDPSIAPNEDNMQIQYQEWDHVSLQDFDVMRGPPGETAKMKESRRAREHQKALEEQRRTKAALHDPSNPLRDRYISKRDDCLLTKEELEASEEELKDARETIQRMEREISALIREKEQRDLREFNDARDHVEEAITIDQTAILPNLTSYIVDVKRDGNGVLTYEQRYEYST